MTGRRIADPGVASSCYFRTSTIAPERKALVQITERCNLHCAHCFVSAGREGIDISLEQMEEAVLPRLRAPLVTAAARGCEQHGSKRKGANEAYFEHGHP